MNRSISLPLLLALLLPAAAGAAPWKFAVLSDIHVGTQADPALAVGRGLRHAVAAAAAEKPDLVVLAGDETRGNEGDGAKPEKVKTWWRSVEVALEPLRAAGIPVAVIPGNHDFYTRAQRAGYEEAWPAFAPALAQFSPVGRPPFYYSFDHGGAHFTLLSVTDQELPAEEAAWLKADLKTAPAGPRFVFGHVPLASAMAKPNASFRDRLGALLAEGGASAYICGHEHLVWDQAAGLPVRQIIVGTAMNRPYTFAIRKALYGEHCNKDGECVMPATGRRYASDPADRLQKVRGAFYIFTVDPALPNGFEAVPYAYDEAGARPFYLPEKPAQ